MLCEVITYLLHYPLEAMIIISNGDFPGFRSLGSGPVKFTFVVAEESVITSRKILTKDFPEFSVCCLQEVFDVRRGIFDFDEVYCLRVR